MAERLQGWLRARAYAKLQEKPGETGEEKQGVQGYCALSYTALFNPQ